MPINNMKEATQKNNKIIRVPKSQEREGKKSSSGDNTLEDVDENVDEFSENENQNI